MDMFCFLEDLILFHNHNRKNKFMNYSIKQMSPLLPVTNIENAIEFYTNKLGFDINFRYQDFYAGIIKDSYSIHLKMKESFNEKKLNKHKEDVDITFSVDNIENLYEELLKKSVNIIQSIRQMPYGKEFYVADPDENILAFLE